MASKTTNPYFAIYSENHLIYNFDEYANSEKTRNLIPFIVFVFWNKIRWISDYSFEAVIISVPQYCIGVALS